MKSRHDKADGAPSAASKPTASPLPAIAGKPALRIVPDPDATSDGAALAAVARGDLGALGQIYDRYALALVRFAARVASAEDADDLVHDAMLIAARNAGRYDPRHASARPWLMGIVARLAQQRRRGLARRARALLGLSRVNSTPALVANEDLARALARLSPAKRVVLVMAEVEGFSGEEIAHALDIPIGTVWTRLHHARRELRAFYGDSQ